MTSHQATSTSTSDPVPSTSAPATAETSSAQTSTQSPSAPSISLTPATPVPVLGSSVPEQPQPPTQMSSPAGITAEKLAGVSGAAKPNTSEKSVAAASSSKSTPPSTAVPASTAKPAASTTKPTGQKKKRRRKGFAGLLLSLGCLSASEFEDDPKEAKKAEAAAAKKTGANGTSEVKPMPTAAAPVIKEKPTETSKAGEPKTALNKGAMGAGAAAGALAGVAGGAIGHGATKGEKDEVVAPPAEAVSPPLDETAGMTSSAVQPPGSGSELLQTTPSRPTAVRRESESAEQTSSGGYTEMLQTEGTDSQDRDENADAEGEEEYGAEEEYEDEEDRLIAQGGIGIPTDEYGRPAPLLPPIGKEHTGRKCLVLDLDETLLHSSFKMLPSADYIVPVEIESQTHNVYVIKRPGVDRFLTEMGKIYEVVVFTASLSKYADPVLDMLDPDGVVKHRLFRESCYNHKGNYVKDLSQLGRTMETCIILDNSPASYIFHPNNAVPVSTWFNDPHDTELTDLCPFLTDLATVDDIRGVLDGTL